MPSVWPLNIAKAEMRIQHATLVADFGDGFEQRLNKNATYSRADGEGGVTSYKGRIEFTINIEGMRQANADSTKEFNKAWNFLKARLGGYEAFYFYNPAEASIDLTGAATTGRYLVRTKEPITSFENFMRHLYRSSLTLIEVRS